METTNLLLILNEVNSFLDLVRSGKFWDGEPSSRTLVAKLLNELGGKDQLAERLTRLDLALEWSIDESNPYVNPNEKRDEKQIRHMWEENIELWLAPDTDDEPGWGGFYSPYDLLLFKVLLEEIVLGKEPTMIGARAYDITNMLEYCKKHAKPSKKG